MNDHVLQPAYAKMPKKKRKGPVVKSLEIVLTKYLAGLVFLFLLILFRDRDQGQGTGRIDHISLIQEQE